MDPSKPLDELAKTASSSRGRDRGRGRGGRGGNTGGRSSASDTKPKRTAATNGAAKATAKGAKPKQQPTKPKTLKVTVVNDRLQRQKPATAPTTATRRKQLQRVPGGGFLAAPAGYAPVAAGYAPVAAASAAAVVRPTAAARKAGDLRATIATGHLTDAGHLAAKKALTTGTKMVITNLESGVTVEDVRELFEGVGPLKSTKMMAVGVAEVIFQRRIDALKAHKDYNHVKLDGRPMYIQVEDESVAAEPTAPRVTSKRLQSS